MHAAEIEQHRRQAVDSEPGIAIDRGDHALGLAAQDQPRRVHQVAADVHDRAAAEGPNVADVGGIVVEEAEGADDRAERTDPS